MTFRGYFALDGVEIANSSRVVAHLTPPTPTADTPTPTCECAELSVQYDDTWTGLAAALGDGPYEITNSPWYTPAIPQSAEFLGVWVMDVQGLDAVLVRQEVIEAMCGGGAAGPLRDLPREVTFSVLIIACTNAGVRFGLNWLSCQLRTAARNTVEMQYYGAHPEDTAATPASLARRVPQMVLTQNPQVQEVGGKGGSNRHRQASLYRAEFKLTALNPYIYGPAVSVPVVWDSSANEAIEWVHAPDCQTPADCDIPVLFNADCVPEVIDVRSAPVPECGGCLPVCEVDRRVYQLDSAITACDETAVTVRVTNTGPDPLTVRMFWQPCGSTDVCDQVHPLQVSGLPEDVVAVADSVEGRAYVEVGGNRTAQVGIITTQTGAPWTPIVIDHGLCWELVAESTPGVTYTVELVLADREP